MKIQENILLALYTTFKIGGPARYFCVVKDQFDALTAFEFAKKNNLKTFILGGGSNLLISDKGFNGLVIKIDNKGVEVVTEDENSVMLKVASGEVWDDTVSFAVSNNWWGIENLSHIPGSTGAIAVQNVGAYGQEAKNVIDRVLVFDVNTHQIITLGKAECGFEYRKSIFNSSEKGRYIIFYIYFVLQKTAQPNLNYRDLKEIFTYPKPLILDIRKAVIEIRDKKFPFPTTAEKGNAGSFFKNPILDSNQYEDLKSQIQQNFGEHKVSELEKKKFLENGLTKVPAAFLIELCKLKDLSTGGAAINQNQPLVIINKSGEATSGDILALAEEVKKVVKEKTSIELLFEPELIGF